MNNPKEENQLLSEIELLDRLVADCLTGLDSLRERISVVLLELTPNEDQNGAEQSNRCIARHRVASVRDNLERLHWLITRTNDEVDL